MKYNLLTFPLYPLCAIISAQKLTRWSSCKRYIQIFRTKYRNVFSYATEQACKLSKTIVSSGWSHLLHTWTTNVYKLCGISLQDKLTNWINYKFTYHTRSTLSRATKKRKVKRNLSISRIVHSRVWNHETSNIFKSISLFPCQIV